MEEQKTWNYKILQALRLKERPLKGAEIYESILEKYPDTNPDTLRVMLTYAINHGVVFKLKYAHSPAFYLHPEWVDEQGQLLPKYEFNRWTKEFTDKTKINEQQS